MIGGIIRRVRLLRICRALAIKPIYPEVKAYVLSFDDEILSGPRANGKTTAVLLRSLVWKEIPRMGDWRHKHLTEKVGILWDVFHNDPDFLLRCHPLDRISVAWYENVLIDALFQCKRHDISVYRRA